MSKSIDKIADFSKMTGGFIFKKTGENMDNLQSFGNEKISKILLRIAPPVMLAQLIQALYNIVDSLFVGRYAESGLTALSIVYPIQLLMIAFAVGIGVGINTVMAAKLGVGERKEANEYAGVGTPLILGVWVLFAVICWLFMPVYARMSSESAAVIKDIVTYGRIVCVFSIGLFLESVWTKVLQAEGDMKTPMIAQIFGAVTNIILDPLLIFGMFGLPKMGIAGAAIATVAGQIIAAIIVSKKGCRKSPDRSLYVHHIKDIFRFGIPNILMQSAYTFYIFGLNMILAGFSDQAVTALGLYYKWQTFFFIPLNAMCTCVVPVISFNYAAKNVDRCKKTLWTSSAFGLIFMALGTLCFIFLPVPMLKVFTADPLVIEIGKWGFRFIGVSFLPIVTALMFPVFFQAIGSGLKSSILTIVRTVVLFVPLGYIFSRFGLEWFWMTFPLTETLTTGLGFIYYRQFCARPYTNTEEETSEKESYIHESRPGVIITIAREHGSSGKQIGKIVAQKLGIPFYYKEMTALAAQESGLDREFISDINKNTPEKLYELYLSTNVVQQAVTAQYKVIQKIAESGSCVIVGRAADHVLRNHDNVLRLFIYAPEEYRAKRVMEIYHDSYEEAKKNIQKSDKARAAYYKSISGNEWGDRHFYDLLIDSSIGVEQTADYILKYVEGNDQFNK